MDQSSLPNAESGAAQGKLERLAARFQLIAEIALEGIWTVDEQQRIDYVNPRAVEILGYTPSELVNHPPPPVSCSSLKTKQKTGLTSPPVFEVSPQTVTYGCAAKMDQKPGSI